jgi:hypothetical protein
MPALQEERSSGGQAHPDVPFVGVGGSTAIGGPAVHKPETARPGCGSGSTLPPSCPPPPQAARTAPIALPAPTLKKAFHFILFSRYAA